mmetsp:Transcript_2907/g.11203  ORF Transcript_2907/g.11203 Transcript_2907/m.11203 type:complete len:297 (+) Transcript_2907:1390-2280(+)
MIVIIANRPLSSSTKGTHPTRPSTVSFPGSVRTSRFKGSTKYPLSARAVLSRLHLHAPDPKIVSPSLSALKLGKQLARITAPTTSSLTPCVAFHANCSKKLFPVVTSTTSPVSTPNIATLAFTSSGSTPSAPNTNNESTLSARSAAFNLSSRAFARRIIVLNASSRARSAAGIARAFARSISRIASIATGSGVAYAPSARSNTARSTSSSAPTSSSSSLASSSLASLSSPLSSSIASSLSSSSLSTTSGCRSESASSARALASPSSSAKEAARARFGGNFRRTYSTNALGKISTAT